MSDEGFGGIEALRREVLGLMDKDFHRHEALRSSDEKRYQERYTAMERAVEVAEANNKMWKADADHWRGLVTERERDFVRQGEKNTLDRDIAELKSQQNIRQGSVTGANIVWAYIVGAAAIVTSLIAILRTMH